MRAKILGDIMNSINSINGYYNTAPGLHKTPMQKVFHEDNFGVRPGTRIHKLTTEEEEALLKAWKEDDAVEEAEREILSSLSVGNGPTNNY
jgi:hypothetical protein